MGWLYACAQAFPPPEPLGQRDDETQAQWRARLTPEQTSNQNPLIPALWYRPDDDNATPAPFDPAQPPMVKLGRITAGRPT